MNNAVSIPRSFVTAAEAIRVQSPWTLDEWLCRSDLVKNEHLLLVRATIKPNGGHPFHCHPAREEIIYVLSGRAEQWVGKEFRIIGPGEMAFIPKGEVHGTYNPFQEKLVFLAILAPANAPGPDTESVWAQEPWATLRKMPVLGS